MKVSYELSEIKKAKLDAEADKRGTKIVDYDKHKRKLAMEALLLGTALVVYLVLGAVGGYLGATQQYYDQTTTLCVNNAVKEFNLSADSSISSVVKYCGWTMGKEVGHELV